MKYTEYIINNSGCDINRLIPKERYVHEVMILVMLPVAIFGIIAFTSVLPFSLAIDSLLLIRVKYYSLKRKRANYKFLIVILDSLAIEVKPSTILRITNVDYPQI